MKFIKAEWNPEWRGYWTDPSGYVAKLPKLADDLPKGARAFALDSDHYDFGSPRCIKDLKLIGASLAAGGGADFEIRFGPNKWKHECGLVIKYAQVSELYLAVNGSGSSVDDLGSVLLDEILPARRGCSQEIVFTGGVISISCADLNAGWE
ncbi:hypothetical protein [Streptomyces himalayensis]|uniref:Uncharacterized protein n=1 Tax=Streptomyces himalayensis subsp. himalayensis TaxID=2756131 RepID=A0A7W0DQF2_9ACTN|nr:hypothetical protein [Streptomyces himalayensis]MBA2948990.1 hypothetical protein [Streptomyces himalayensis subsp. himalayensis]